MRYFILYYLSIWIIIVRLYIIHVNKYITSIMYRVLGMSSTFSYDRYTHEKKSSLKIRYLRYKILKYAIFLNFQI